MDNKVVVIGVDGGTFDFIKPWIEQGKLPNFEELLKNGISGKLRTTITPSTIPAWPAYCSGKNPGKIGAIHWRSFNKKKKRVERTRIENISEMKIWDILGDKYKSIIVNIPGTFPPEPLNGCMVASMGTPSIKSTYTYPKALQGEIKENIGTYSPFLNKMSKDKGHFLSIKESLEKRFEVTKYLFENKKWDFFSVVFRSTDNVSHHHSKDKILEIYEMMDKKLGYFISKECNLIIISDHGFLKETQQINLNKILIKEGFLKLKEEEPEPSLKVKILGNFIGNQVNWFIKKFNLRPFIEKFNFLRDRLPRGSSLNLKNVLLMDLVDWKNTKAIAETFPKTGAIYFIGKISKNDKERIKKAIGKYLPENAKIKIKLKNEIWEGENLENFPDLVVISEDKIGFTSGFEEDKIISNRERMAHSYDGIFLAYGPDIKSTGEELEGLNIIDIAPTVLHLMNSPISEDMDGRVLKEIFKKDSDPARRKVEYIKPQEKERKVKYKMSKEEDRKIRKRLKDLGYLD